MGQHCRFALQKDWEVGGEIICFYEILSLSDLYDILLLP